MPAKGKPNFQPTRWPRWRKELNKILLAEGAKPLNELVARLEQYVPPDQALHVTERNRRTVGIQKPKNSRELDTRHGQRSIIFGGIHSSLVTGFYVRWINDDDEVMLDLGPKGKFYYEERRAQGHQPPTVHSSREGTAGADRGNSAE